MLPRSWVAGFAALIALAISGRADALAIDFTSADFAAANGQQSYSTNIYSTNIEGVGVTVIDARPVGAELTQTSDGLGVDTPWRRREDPNEIGFPERIIISFDQEQFIEDVYVAQLFKESGWLGTISETGWYSIDGGERVLFSATGAADGLLPVHIGEAVSRISFGAKLIGGSHDYSIAGLNLRATLGGAVTAIPEPISMTLLGVGGIVIGAAVRRRPA